MTLADVLKRPSVAKVLKDNKASEVEIYPKSKTVNLFLASVLEKLTEDQVLVVKVKRYYSDSWLKILHKSSVIKMHRYDSLEDAVSNNAIPENLLIKGLNNMLMDEIYIGDKKRMKKALEMALKDGGKAEVIVPSVGKQEVEKYPFTESNIPLVDSKQSNPS